MPRTRYDPVLDMAFAQRGAHVRADVVDGKIVTVPAEKRDKLVCDLDRPAFARSEVADPTHRLKFGHACPFAQPAWTANGFAGIILAWTILCRGRARLLPSRVGPLL